MGDPAPPRRRTHGGAGAGALALVKPLPPEAVAGRPGFTRAKRPRLQSPPADRWAAIQDHAIAPRLSPGATSPIRNSKEPKLVKRCCYFGIKIFYVKPHSKNDIIPTQRLFALDNSELALPSQWGARDFPGVNDNNEWCLRLIGQLREKYSDEWLRDIVLEPGFQIPTRVLRDFCTIDEKTAAAVDGYRQDRINDMNRNREIFELSTQMLARRQEVLQSPKRRQATHTKK
jgi:hypothetical protein